MDTLLKKADKETIALAAELLSSGEIVAIPTETVYGIAGNAYNGDIVKKIYEAKGRPSDNPLIVHISDMDMLYDVAGEVNEDALKLADAFWPGPLTIIVPKGDKVSSVTCGGLDSVGVRMPADPAAHDIIKACGFPLSAPSANLSGKPSPTTAADVFADMNGRLPLVVDGGESERGVESTVISVLDAVPVLLRPGYVTKEDMEEVLGKDIIVSSAIMDKLPEGEQARSPGMKYKHYSPAAQITILEGEYEAFAEYVNSNIEDGLFALCFEGEDTGLNVPCVVYGKKDDASTQAHMLFAALRELDKRGAKKVYARCPKRRGVSMAVFNRLIRAAAFRLIQI